MGWHEMGFQPGALFPDSIRLLLGSVLITPESLVVCSLCLEMKANFLPFPYLKLCLHSAGKDDSISGYFVHLN